MAIWTRTTLTSMAAAVGATLLLAAGAANAEPLSGEKVYQRHCQGCHGPTLGGAASIPSLLASPKSKDKEAFVKTVTGGQGAMPAQGGNKAVTENIDALYEFVNGKATAAK